MDPSWPTPRSSRLTPCTTALLTSWRLTEWHRGRRGFLCSLKNASLIKYCQTWYPKQPFFNGWKWWNNNFLCNDLVHHPLETTIKNWLFRVPGTNVKHWYPWGSCWAWWICKDICILPSTNCIIWHPNCGSSQTPLQFHLHKSQWATTSATLLAVGPSCRFFLNGVTWGPYKCQKINW